jgi:branched-chain amino acid transport system ATP-binding protein
LPIRPSSSSPPFPLDEPTGGLIPEETDRITRLIEKVRDQGTTVCLIEHKMQMVMGLADRIVVLNYGKKIAEGKPEQVKSNQAVIEAYLGGEVHA